MELIVVEGPDQGRSFRLGPSSVVGRDPTAAINLTDEEVSRRHAIVSVDEGRVTVEDLGSSNGTYVESGRIDNETELGAGKRMRVGQTVMELQAGAGADPENLPPTKVPLPELGDPPEQF